MKRTFAKNEIPDMARDIIAKVLAARRESSDRATVVALSGDLGAGKTTLTQAIARELGIKETVISPTFVIMKTYPLAEKSGFSRLVHVDAYRLESSGEIERLGWAEIISDPENLVLIEWPEKVPEAIPDQAVRIALSHADEDSREMRFD